MNKRQTRIFPLSDEYCKAVEFAEHLDDMTELYSVENPGTDVMIDVWKTKINHLYVNTWLYEKLKDKPHWYIRVLEKFRDDFSTSTELHCSLVIFDRPDFIMELVLVL